jgi:hypothetical protein
VTARRDPRGTLVPLGSFEHRFSYSPAFGDALPTWLAVQAGTGTATNASSGSSAANYSVASAATANAGARLWVTQDIRPSQYDEIIFTLQGLKFSVDNGFDIRIEIGATAQDKGISLRQDNNAGPNDTTATLRAHTGAGVFVDHTTHYVIQRLNGGSRKPRNLTLRWRPKIGEVLVLEDDQVMVVQSIGTEADAISACRPMVTLTTKDATARSFSFARLEVALRSRI